VPHPTGSMKGLFAPVCQLCRCSFCSGSPGTLKVSTGAQLCQPQCLGAAGSPPPAARAGAAVPQCRHESSVPRDPLHCPCRLGLEPPDSPNGHLLQTRLWCPTTPPHHQLLRVAHLPARVTACAVRARMVEA